MAKRIRSGAKGTIMLTEEETLPAVVDAVGWADDFPPPESEDETDLPQVVSVKATFPDKSVCLFHNIPVAAEPTLGSWTAG